MKQQGLILEGGGQRGVFTAGVLNLLMEKEILFSNVYGVSAGACNAVDYTAGQTGRTKKCMITSDKAYRYVSLKNIIRSRSLFDMDMLFDKLPNQYIPFDYDAFFNSKVKCELVATNCLTGRAEYFSEDKNKKQLMDICRASSSLPLASPMVYIHGVPYLDGGIADSIPLARSIKMGNHKHVLILTRNYGYRKKSSHKNNALVLSAYRNYPDLAYAILRRPAVYNRCIDIVEKLEKQGKVFVIRPDTGVVARTERNVEKLEAFYQHGYETMEKRLDEMHEYLNH